MSTVRFHANGIPIKVLKGEVKEFISVRNLYRSVMYTRYMEMLHKSYYDRAFWGTDEFGQRWYVLTVLTDIIKNSGWDEDEDKPIGNQPQLTGKFVHKRYLSPDQLKQYKAEFRAGVEAGKAPRTMDRHALKNVEVVDGGSRRNFDDDRDIPRTPINIRTGRLAAAFSPGEVANNRIYGGPDQTFFLDGLNFRFNVLKVPYAEDVQKPIKRGAGYIQRILITDVHVQGLYRAHDVAIVAAKNEYDNLLAKRKQRRKTNDNRKTDNSSRR